MGIISDLVNKAKSLSVPQNPLSINPGTQQTLDEMGLSALSNRTLIQQVRGITPNGSTGAGIPKVVTDVKASVSNASTGSTSVVTVIFHRDPSDNNFAGVTVLAKGYQGNNTPVQVGSSTDSPATFVLNNTGEAVNLIVQPFGNAGNAPLAKCPSVGIQLPKSATGGVGVSSSTSSLILETNGTKNGSQSLLNLKNGTAIAITQDGSGNVTVNNTGVTSVGVSVPAEFSVSGSPVTGSGTIAISKANENANTVWAGPASGAAAAPAFRSLVSRDLIGAVAGHYGWRVSNGSGGITAIGTSAPLSLSNTTTNVAATSTDPCMITYVTINTAATTSYGIDDAGGGTTFGAGLAYLQQSAIRARINQTTNVRYWIGLVQAGHGPGANTTGLSTDTPNFGYAAFRFSAGTDTTWKAVCGTATANQTVVDTGVAPSTAATTLFEIGYDGTNVLFYINGVLKASISTNLPTSAVLVNSIEVDNKSTANAQSVSVAYAMMYMA